MSAVGTLRRGFATPQVAKMRRRVGRSGFDRQNDGPAMGLFGSPDAGRPSWPHQPIQVNPNGYNDLR